MGLLLASVEDCFPDGWSSPSANSEVKARSSSELSSDSATNCGEDKEDSARTTSNSNAWSDFEPLLRDLHNALYDFHLWTLSLPPQAAVEPRKDGRARTKNVEAAVASSADRPSAPSGTTTARTHGDLLQRYFGGAILDGSSQTTSTQGTYRSFDSRHDVRESSSIVKNSSSRRHLKPDLFLLCFKRMRRVARALLTNKLCAAPEAERILQHFLNVLESGRSGALTAAALWHALFPEAGSGCASEEGVLRWRMPSPRASTPFRCNDNEAFQFQVNRESLAALLISAFPERMMMGQTLATVQPAGQESYESMRKIIESRCPGEKINAITSCWKDMVQIPLGSGTAGSQNAWPVKWLYQRSSSHSDHSSSKQKHSPLVDAARRSLFFEDSMRQNESLSQLFTDSGYRVQGVYADIQGPGDIIRRKNRRTGKTSCE
ncbi:unnamed protein product, partial [Amoebophrya sp. A120]|eukprot:GSA120T00024250001.1